MDTSILSISQLQQASRVNLSRFAAISEQDVYLWSEPGEWGEAVAVVAADVPMTIIGAEGEWLLVSAAEYTGYVSAAEVNIERMLNAEVDSEGYIKLARAEKELQEQLAAEEAVQAEAEEYYEYEEEYEDFEEESYYEESYEEYEEPEYEEVEEETYEDSSYEEPEVSYSGESSANGLAIMNLALTYQGVPYVWGGHSPSGFDCSGLIYYCAMQNGISIPRCADTQYFEGNGYHVDYDQLLPGDLVFFSSDSSYDIEHVGIYIGGNQFVHASSGAGYVTISTIADYYSRNYYSAMRLN
ncbi:MAG: C40 family peptidase [Firmicutes bacterium]|nr:C40 family peptidase [Bacillota bacterium]